MRDFEGRVAVVTGAASGIGHAAGDGTVLQLAASQPSLVRALLLELLAAPVRTSTP